MAKKPETVVETPAAEVAPAPEVVTVNRTINFRKHHPKNRCTYGIPGVPGVIVIDKGMLADPTAPPATLTLSCDLQLPRAPKADKAEAQAAKAAAKAEREAAKVTAAAAKAVEKQAKADAALAKAREKAEAAQAKLAAATASTAPAVDAPAQS